MVIGPRAAEGNTLWLHGISGGEAIVHLALPIFLPVCCSPGLMGLGCSGNLVPK